MSYVVYSNPCRKGIYFVSLSSTTCLQSKADKMSFKEATTSASQTLSAAGEGREESSSCEGENDM